MSENIDYIRIDITIGNEETFSVMLECAYGLYERKPWHIQDISDKTSGVAEFVKGDMEFASKKLIEAFRQKYPQKVTK